MEKKHSALGLYLAAGLIPMVLLLVCFALLGMAPFGDSTLLFSDAAIQYLDFAAYLKTVFAGENDLIYTFSKNLGGEMVSLFCYYLLSPFSILFAFGTLENLPLVFTLVAVLKIAACGVTFFHASVKRFGCKWSHLIFSTAYALMAYNTLFGWNIMWMDGVLILPLLALGLEKLWRGASHWLYTACLAYALLTNFYIGYMLCIASVLFSFALMASMEEPWKVRCTRFGTFIGASCIGGFAAAFAWLPTFFTLIGGRGEATTSLFVWAKTFNVLGLAGKVVAGSANADQVSLGTPHIFCGIFTILLVLVFFLQDRRSVKHRLTTLGVMGVLVVSFCIRGLDVIWHGFSPNNAYNFRYAFLFSYVLLVVAQYAWASRRETRNVWFALSGILLLLMCAGLLVMKRFMGLDFLSIPGIGISAAVTLVTMGYLLLGHTPRRFAGALFALVCLFELGANYALSIRQAAIGTLVLDIPQYQNFLQQTLPAVDEVKQMDSGFYRMEKTFSRNKNDAMLLNYNGLTHFSSSQDKVVPRFMKKLGMTTMEGIWAQYGSGATATVDSLFGVKFVLSGSDLAEQKDFLLRSTVNDIGIYENPQALPIAMISDRAILQADPGAENNFTLQNAMLGGIAGVPVQALKPVTSWSLALDNLLEAETGVYYRENPEAEISLTYTLEITEAMPLYLYFRAPQEQGVSLYVNDTYAGEYFSPYRWDTVYVGTYQPGDRVTIKLASYSEELRVEEALFFYEDLQALSTAVEAIRSNPVQLQRQTSSRLTGSFTAREEGLLLFTIPNDGGWQLTVDGVPAACTTAMGLFLAAEVSPGSHSFELQYVPRGGYVGCGISAAAIAAAILWGIQDKKKKQMP